MCKILQDKKNKTIKLKKKKWNEARVIAYLELGCRSGQNFLEANASRERESVVWSNAYNIKTCQVLGEL